MGKPSIFSRDYKVYMERRKKRKRVFIITLFIFTIVSISYVVYDFNSGKNIVTKIPLIKNFDFEKYKNTKELEVPVLHDDNTLNEEDENTKR